VGEYQKKAMEDADDAIEYFMDEIVEQLIEIGEAETDIQSRPYPQSYHHESHVDSSYSLLEAANLLDDLSDYEETDEGLWDGQMPRQAISIQAAFTYGNAVASMFSDEMETVNGDCGERARELGERRSEIEELLDQAEGDPDLEARLRKELEDFTAYAERVVRSMIRVSIGREEEAKHPKDWKPRGRS